MKRVLLPSTIEALNLYVALDHKALLKNRTQAITSRIGSKKDLYKQLRYHFLYRCKIGGYCFPPSNFDVGVSRLLNRPSPTTIIPIANKRNSNVSAFFDSHPVYSQRIIRCILRAGTIDDDDNSDEFFKQTVSDYEPEEEEEDKDKEEDEDEEEEEETEEEEEEKDNGIEDDDDNNNNYNQQIIRDEIGNPKNWSNMSVIDILDNHFWFVRINTTKDLMIPAMKSIWNDILKDINSSIRSRKRVEKIMQSTHQLVINSRPKEMIISNNIKKVNNTQE